MGDDYFVSKKPGRHSLNNYSTLHFYRCRWQVLVEGLRCITFPSSFPPAHTYTHSSRHILKGNRLLWPLISLCLPSCFSFSQQNSIICPCQACEWPCWPIFLLSALIFCDFPAALNTNEQAPPLGRIFLLSLCGPTPLRLHLPLKSLPGHHCWLPPLLVLTCHIAPSSSCPPQGLPPLNLSAVGWWCFWPLPWASGSHIQLPSWYLPVHG